MSRSSASSYAHLLRLYPRVWRARYEDEFLALLEDRPPTALHVFDIILGALDAHLHREMPGTDAQRRRERSSLMNRNLYAATAIAAAALLLFTVYGDTVGLDPILVMVFVPLMLAAVVASTLGLARRSDRPALASAGAVLAMIGAVASLGALALIALQARLLGLDGWDVAGLTLAALLIGQAIVAGSTWRAAYQLRPGLGMIAAGAAWIVVGTAYMALTRAWIDGFLPMGWAIVAAGWLWIGVATLRARASVTA